MKKQSFHKPVSKMILFGFVLGITAIVIAAISIAGYRLGWWRHPDAFIIFEWGAYVAIIALIISVYSTLKIRIQNQRRGQWLGIAGMALSLPVITATALFEYSATVYPRINDVSTDTQDPPSFWDVPMPMEYPGQRVADIQQAAYPDLKPLFLSIAQEKVFEQALLVVLDKGWQVIAKDPVEGRIEAVDTSLLFGFKDEVVLRIASSDNNGTLVDIRSRSRIGLIDRGANAKRIQDYLKTLKESIAGEQKE